MKAINDCSEQHVAARGVCGDCKFWKRPSEASGWPDGLCKRYPSQRMMVPDDWCGEWKEEGDKK